MNDCLRIGTAGWSIASRYNDVVPRGGSHLDRYARALSAVEINSSFHRPHRRKTYARWADSVPDDFRFAVKLPRVITHEKRLRGCADDVAAFADQVAGLGDKLAVLLVQLPPSLTLDRRSAGQSFKLLNRLIAARIAVEPRHASWFAPGISDWLASRQIARVAADPAKISGAGDPGGAADLVYFRWHGAPRMYYSDYDQAGLQRLHRRLTEHRDAGAETWCIFDNTASSAALGNALSLAAR